MNIFGGIFGKKEEPAQNVSHNQSIDESSHKQEATPQSGANPNLFGGFVQVKRKPSGSVNKPKGFDPFAMGTAKTTEPQGLTGQNYDQQGDNRSLSGHGSLSQLDEENTPKAGGDSLPDVGKKSAFGFIQKKPIKQPEPQASQNLSFVSNVNATRPEQSEFESNADGNSILERGTSMSSNDPEPANPPSKGSAFGFIKKKTVEPEASKKQISVNLDASQQDLGSARASSDTKSDNGEGKNPGTPPESGSRFIGRSPGSVYSSKQSEPDSTIATYESKSDYQDKLKAPESNPAKPSGPSFGKFKKPEAPKVQTNELLQKTGSPGMSDRALSHKNNSPHSGSKGSTKPFKTRSEPERTIQPESMALKVDRITSPLQAIQTPAVQDQETPEGVKQRLAKEKSEILENIGDLISRQNGLMGKKRSLETQRENTSKKLKQVANQQNEAIENDNFEEADHLEVVIIELNESMRDLEKQIDDCQLAYTDLEREKQSLYQNEAMVLKRYISEIEEILLNQNYNYEKYKLECQSQQNSEKSYIEEKTKELQYIRNHIELDLKHINEENSQVQETLNKHIKDFVVERDDLTNRKDDLETRIEEIRKQLKAHEEELVDVTRNLGKVTAKITSVTSKFDDQISKIKRRRDKVTEEDEKYRTEVTRLDKHKETVEYSIKRLEEVSENYNKMLENYKQIIAQLTEDSSTKDKENANREKVIRLYYDSLGILRQEKHQLLSCEEDIDKLKDDLNRVQKETNSIFAQKNTLANKIPSLEKEKKEFVASRSFKDASRVSNDIKDIQTKITEYEEKLNELSENEKQTIQKINTLERETIPSLRERVNTTSKDCDLNKYELLKVKEDDLKLIHSHYLEQKIYQEASLIESELKDAQRQLTELLSQHPELQKREAAINNQKEKEKQAREEQEKRERTEKENKEAQQSASQEVAVDQKTTEKVDQAIPETANKKEAEQAEPRKEIPLPDLIAEFDENKANIDKMDGEIDRLASEELYGEAEEISEQQAKLRSRQEEIIQDIHRLGFADIEEARANAGKTDNDDETQKETPINEEEKIEVNEVNEVNEGERNEPNENKEDEVKNVEEDAVEIINEQVDEEKEPVVSGDQNDNEQVDEAKEPVVSGDQNEGENQENITE